MFVAIKGKAIMAILTIKSMMAILAPILNALKKYGNFFFGTPCACCPSQSGCQQLLSTAAGISMHGYGYYRNYHKIHEYFRLE